MTSGSVLLSAQFEASSSSCTCARALQHSCADEHGLWLHATASSIERRNYKFCVQTLKMRCP